MIDKYYAREDKKEKKRELKKDLIDKIKEKEVTPPESREIVSATFDKEKVGELSLEEIESYMELLDSEEYKSIIG